uniref:Transposase n=1 Tax=Cyprinus carpio TaxID=7962 RepID=A0A8C1ZPL9_CYPCA
MKAESTERKEIHLSGDGRSDSPGYSAKYTTYSLMDDITDQVLHFELVQVCVHDNGEICFDDNIGVSVVTTDRSPSIRKIMQVDYQNIHQGFDVWHVAKGIIKKLASLSRYKDNRALQPWIKSIGNHLWFTCSSCGELIKRWKSLLQHISKKKKWIDQASRAFITLENLVLDEGLLKDLRQMLEVFHSLLLKYCPKRIHFQYTSVLARTQLAVLDHNENVQRQQARTKTAKFNVVFPKHSKQWVARKLYEAPTQNFREELVRHVLQRRMDSSIIYKDSSSHLEIQPVPKNIAQQTKPSKEDTVSKYSQISFLLTDNGVSYLYKVMVIHSTFHGGFL